MENKLTSKLEALKEAKSKAEGKNLSWRAVARTTGLSNSAIARVRDASGARVDWATIITLARYFGCRSISDVIDLA